MIDEVQQRELLRELERGHRIAQLLKAPGYADLLQILEDEVAKSEFRLINLPPGSSIELLRDLHIAARVSRSLLEQLQLRLHGIVEASEIAVNAQFRPQADYSETQYNNL